MQSKFLAFTAAIALLAGGAGAQAQTIKLRVADVYPVGHTVSNTTIKVFMEDVKARLGNKIDFEYYPAEQLGKGKDLLSLTQSGVVDIGLVVPSYISEKLPLSAVSELPGGYRTSCQGTMAMHELSTGDGILAKQEFGPNGVRVLITHSFAPFQAFSSKPYEGLKSYAGQKLRTLGLVTDLTIKSMGAVPIRISAPEINEAMARGTIDGGLLGVATVISYDLIRYLKSATYGESFGGTVVTYTISETNWRKLPKDVQDAMVEAGKAATLNGCKEADKSVDTHYEKLKAAGVQVVKLDAADRESFSERTASIGKDWAATLDQRNKPASKVLEAFQAAIKKY
jgi:TRAP-type C4-dicarboxylate transport system substrate-binding protein